MTDFIVKSNYNGTLRPQAKTRHARGIAQALDILSRERFRVIWSANYLEWGPGTAEVWDRIENHRLFYRTNLRFGNLIGWGE